MASPTPRALLVGHTLSDLTKNKHKVSRLILLRQDSTIEEALKALAAQKILSAPVVVPAEGATIGEEFSPNQSPQDILGFVDIQDILTGFLTEVDMSTIAGVKMLKRMHILEEAGRVYSSKTLKDLPSLGGDGSFLFEGGKAHVTVMEVVHNGFLFPGETKAIHGGDKSARVVHRVALFDKSGRITSIVSQSDVIKFLNEHSDSLGALGKATVASLGWGKADDVKSVPLEMPAIEVMDMMAKANPPLSAVAVVATPSGQLMGNFSASELRTIVAERFGALALPVGEFLALEHGTEFWGRADKEEIQGTPGHQFASQREQRARRTADGGKQTPGDAVGQNLITAHANDTLAEVLGKVVANRLHRLYVVDEDGRPVGVITLTDILAKVVQESQTG